MEQIRLPFPSLQFLAAHVIVRPMVFMKVDIGYWCTGYNYFLRKCERRVDTLPLPPAPREYVRNVLNGFFQQVEQWTLHSDENDCADILVDVRGNVDERRIVRHHFEKRYKGEFYRDDFRAFARLLEHLFWYYPEDYGNDFVSIVVNLQDIYTFLEGPVYRIVNGELHVVFRFVNPRKVPPAFNALLQWNKERLEISMEQNDVLVTYRVYKRHYDEDMFRIHVDLLQPSQRLEFVKMVVYNKMSIGLVQDVIRLLNVLDPQTRRNCLLCLNEDRYHEAAYDFLGCSLISGYESLFMPMMKLVGLNLDKTHYVEIFADLVDKMDFIGFDGILLQFWELVPTRKKSEFHRVLEDHDDEYHDTIKEAMTKLSEANTALFQVLFDDMFASPPEKKARLAP